MKYNQFLTLFILQPVMFICGTLFDLIVLKRDVVKLHLIPFSSYFSGLRLRIPFGSGNGLLMMLLGTPHASSQRNDSTKKTRVSDFLLMLMDRKVFLIEKKNLCSQHFCGKIIVKGTTVLAFNTRWRTGSPSAANLSNGSI